MARAQDGKQPARRRFVAFAAAGVAFLGLAAAPRGAAATLRLSEVQAAIQALDVMLAVPEPLGEPELGRVKRDKRLVRQVRAALKRATLDGVVTEAEARQLRKDASKLRKFVSEMMRQMYETQSAIIRAGTGTP